MRNLLLSISLLADIAMAQTGPHVAELKTFYETTRPDDRAEALARLFEPPVLAAALANLPAERTERVLKNVERGRGGQNLSSASVGDGSTSLTQLADAVGSFGAALENGGFAQNTSGTVTTLSVRPIAIYNALRHGDTLECQQFRVLVRRKDECSNQDYFKGLSTSVSFDTSRDVTVAAKPIAVIESLGQISPVIEAAGHVVRLTTNPRSISSWGVKYEIYNPRNSRNSNYMEAWDRALEVTSVKTVGADFNAKVIAAFIAFDTPTPNPTPQQTQYNAWKAAAIVKVESAGSWEELNRLYEEAVLAWSELERVKTQKALVAGLEKSRLAFIEAENKEFATFLDKPIVSLAYTNTRPLSQPEQSNVKLLISKPFNTKKMVNDGSSEAMLSFNLSADFYNSIPKAAKVGRVRDVQAALQLDLPGGKLGDRGALLYSLSAYYQYQIEPGLITIGSGSLAPNTDIVLPSTAKTLLTPKGSMFIAQAKMTIKANDGKTSIPIGFSWSNRTELIKADHTFRGHIGLQFDWGSLLGSN